MPAQTYRKRPNVCTTENYLGNFNSPTVPGNNSHPTASKSGKNIFAVGERHVSRIK